MKPSSKIKAVLIANELRLKNFGFTCHDSHDKRITAACFILAPLIYPLLHLKYFFNKVA